jgi:hypothetical protein
MVDGRDAVQFAGVKDSRRLTAAQEKAFYTQRPNLVKDPR